MKYLTLKLKTPSLGTMTERLKYQSLLFEFTKPSSYLWRRTRSITSRKLRYSFRLCSELHVRTYMLKTDSFKIHSNCSYFLVHAYKLQLFSCVVYFNAFLAKQPWIHLLFFSVFTVFHFMWSRYSHYFEILRYLAVCSTRSFKQVFLTASASLTTQRSLHYVQPFKKL